MYITLLKVKEVFDSQTVFQVGNIQCILNPVEIFVSL
jgi:hypothetical protein